MLHYGREANNEDVSIRYKKLFREKLDPDGNPIPYEVFRKYMLGVLDELDPDENAQEMIIEQFIAESRLARRAFYETSMKSEGDTPFRPKLSHVDDEWSVNDISEFKSFTPGDTKSSPIHTKSSPNWTPPKGASRADKFALAITPPPVDHPQSTQQTFVNKSFHQESDFHNESDPISTPSALHKYSEVL